MENICRELEKKIYENRIDSPNLVTESNIDKKINSIICAAMKERNPTLKDKSEESRPYWKKDFFNLNKAPIFNELNEDAQNHILTECAQGMLEESYYIEKSGTHYTSKMMLLSESTQEKMLYATIAYDEVVHFHSICSFLYRDPSSFNNQSFICLLKEMIETGDKPTLTFIIQVLLEGWGITHYQQLMKNAQDPNLAQAFREILADEARHHGSGVTLFEASKLNNKQVSYIVEALVRFFEMIRIGQVSVISNTEKATGHLSKDQKIKMLESIDNQAVTYSKLELLKTLIVNHSGRIISDKLEKYNAFRPYSNQESVEFLSMN